MSLFLLFSVNYSNSLIWNDIGRNCLLGHRKKIAKFLNEDFYLLLYLPVWLRLSCLALLYPAFVPPLLVYHIAIG
jgi:hypothetical protein